MTGVQTCALPIFGLARAAARTLLTIFVLPAAMVDTDGRGMHDRATGTAVILG